MTTPIAPIKLSDIFTEFSTQVGPWPPPGYPVVNMGAYYRGGSYVPIGQATSATDGTAVSTSGLIRVGMFRGLTKSVAVANSVGYEYSGQRFGVCVGTITFNTDGTASASGTGTTFSSNSPNWYTPTTAGIGSSYWARFNIIVLTGGIDSTPSLNVWLPMSTTRTVQLSTGSDAEATIQMSLEFSSSSSGTPIIGSNTIEIFVLNSQI